MRAVSERGGTQRSGHPPTLPLSTTSALTTFLALMASAFVLLPFFIQNEILGALLRLSIQILLIGLVLRLNVGRRLVAFVIGVAVLDAIADWTAALHEMPPLTLVRLVLALTFFGTAAALIGQEIWRAQRVETEAILGAVAVYCLLGLCWGLAFSIVEFAEPGSFHNVCEPRLGDVGCQATLADFPRLYYFSFVTLTTLGYGDVVPLTRVAEGVVTMASVSGQLFLAIMIGRVVGMHIAQQRSGPD
jgi:hypothetical protein